MVKNNEWTRTSTTPKGPERTGGNVGAGATVVTGILLVGGLALAAGAALEHGGSSHKGSETSTGTAASPTAKPTTLCGKLKGGEQLIEVIGVDKAGYTKIANEGSDEVGSLPDMHKPKGTIDLGTYKNGRLTIHRYLEGVNVDKTSVTILPSAAPQGLSGSDAASFDTGVNNHFLATNGQEHVIGKLVFHNTNFPVIEKDMHDAVAAVGFYQTDPNFCTDTYSAK